MRANPASSHDAEPDPTRPRSAPGPGGDPLPQPGPEGSSPSQPDPDRLEEPDLDLTPSESARIIAEQGALVRHRTDVSDAVVYLAWGVAWTVGYLGMWLSATGRLPSGLPTWVPGALFAALMAGAMAVTVVAVVRASRGVRGRSQTVGTVYGLTWALAFLGVGFLAGALEGAGASREVLNLYWAVAPVLTVGVMYLMGGLVWDQLSWSTLGGILVIAAILACLSPRDYCLVLALAAGGTLLVGALVAHLAGRRRDRRAWEART